MKNDQFIKLLEHPQSLNEIPLADIEILYSKYPFSKNIQILYNKKRVLLGLTQNKKPLEKLRAQHNHPVLLNHILKPISQEEYSDMNSIYDTIFEDLDESKKQETKVEEKIESRESPLNIVKEAAEKNTEVTNLETKKDANIVDVSSKIDSKKEQIKKQKLKTIQLTEISKAVTEQNTTKKAADIKFIEVEEFETKTKKKSKKKKKKQVLLKSKKLKKTKQNKQNKTTINKKQKPKRKVKKNNKNKFVSEKELDYFDWLDSLKSTSEILKVPDKTDKKKSKKSKITSIKKKKKEKKKKSKLQNKIDQSLLRNSKIYTETLATLMEKQGHKKQAIDIYKQLMVNNPEKSDYFADRIQKLK